MRSYVLFLVILIAVDRRAPAQAVSVGVKGGLPLADLPSGGQNESRLYLVGPSVEVRLPAGFAIEASALYRRIGNTARFGLLGINLDPANPMPTGAQGPIAVAYSRRERGNSWEFPLLGKYYFRQRVRGWQPFVGTGYAFRTVGFHSDSTQTNIDPSGVVHTFPIKNDLRSQLGIGATVAAGFRFRTGRVSMLPEVRYTRWGNSDGLNRKNALGLLLGISF